jgi:hypothetical protein
MLHEEEALRGGGTASRRAWIAFDVNDAAGQTAHRAPHANATTVSTQNDKPTRIGFLPNMNTRVGYPHIVGEN